MKPRTCYAIIFYLILSVPVTAQTRRMVAIGSSTTFGLSASTDSSWVRRFSNYYKNQLAVMDTAHNLGVSSTTVYNGMPTSYIPSGRPSPDPAKNVTQAVTLLSDLTVPANGVVIVNFPSNGYDIYTIPEILSALQLIYDSATRLGNKCYITTTQPRSDGAFGTSAGKRKQAVIKDSIINRFGIARTINFYDGMYNPADSTILPAYSAGDNIHFNNTGHRILFERVRAKNVFDISTTAYRSNVSPTGVWENASSWQIFNGSTWVAATIPPSSGSGAITILNGDSIRINSYTELDQVTIEGGGILAMFNTTGTPPMPVVISLNDAAGDDLVVNSNGKLYVSANATLNGTGTVRNQAGGLFTLRNRAVLETSAINDGVLYISGTGNVRNRTVTNNEIFVLQDFTLNLINASFINNDSMSITGSGSTFIADSTLTGGSFSNTSAGVIFRQSATGSTTFSNSITVTNNGKIKGLGEYVFLNTAGGTGSIAPGSSPGRLTVNPAFFTGRTPTINIELSSTGAVQGTNYDHLIISNVSPTTKNISGTTLNITDNANDPVGTVYTIITPASGTITGTFAAVNLPPTLIAVNYNGGNFISVTKTFALPVQWGDFSAKKKENDVLLEWTTLQESNSSHFIVEHAIDGISFTAIGRREGKGNSSTGSYYNFLHESPVAGNNYYRIRQFDKDGKFSGSVTRQISISGETLPVLITPNPVRDMMQVTANRSGLVMIITDMAGKMVYTERLSQGLNPVNTHQLLPGIYQVAVFEKKYRVYLWKMLKL